MGWLRVCVGLRDLDLVGSALYRPSLIPASPALRLPCPPPFTCYARGRELCDLRQEENEGRRCSWSAPLRDAVEVCTGLSEANQQRVRECSMSWRYVRLGIRMRSSNEGRMGVGRTKGGCKK